METVAFIIICLVLFATTLKVSWHSWGGMIFTATVLALFVWLSCDSATGRSTSQIQSWLADSALMLDIAVLLTVDVAFQICFCIFRARRGLSAAERPIERIARTLTGIIPGVLVFPALYAVLVEVIFALPGVDFGTIALVCAFSVLVIIPLAGGAMRRLLPEDDLRLELLFLISLLIAALGIVATVNGRTAAAGVSQVEYSALGAVAVLVIAGLLVGIGVYRRRQTTKIRHIL